MMFTGNAKELFEKWFKNSPQCIKLAYVILTDLTYNELVERFYQLSFPMQQGVYLQFLREQITNRINTDSRAYHELLWCFKGMDILSTDIAFIAAITKAGELLNNSIDK